MESGSTKPGKPGIEFPGDSAISCARWLTPPLSSWIRSAVRVTLAMLAATSRTASEVETTLRVMIDVAAGKTAADIKTGPKGRAIVTGGEGTATRCMELLGAIFAFAVERGLREDNPVHGVRKYAGQRRERFLTGEELTRLGEVMQEMEQEGVNPVAIASQMGWPLCMPLVRKMGPGLWEARSHLPDRIARILFTVEDARMVLLHGFIKKSQQIPDQELETAQKRLAILRSRG